MTLPHCRSFTFDIGLGGFSAEVLRVLPPGTAVEGTIEFPERLLPYVGIVAWARAGGPHMGVRGRMGIALTLGHSELRRLILASKEGPSRLTGVSGRSELLGADGFRGGLRRAISWALEVRSPRGSPSGGST